MAAVAAASASATVDPDCSPPLRLNYIPAIDLRLLSQSELYSLSKCSNSSFDLNRCDDVVIPKIDRSVFNESAGSRKQTYSRLRLAPAESSKTTIHRRTPRLRSSHPPASNNINDPEQAENSQIICVLKELFKSDPNFEDLAPIEVENDSNVVAPELLNPEASELLNPEAPELLNPEAPELLKPEAPELLNTEAPESLNPEMKRKRGRPRKHENAVSIRPPATKRMRNSAVKKVVVYDNDRDSEIVNSRGVTVNIANLGRLSDPYGPEIRKRSAGMSTADELLGFLRGLSGRWGTTRKKRRVVDASDFGDALPKGWKLSLCIKKKEGRVWLFCRRYISPSGRQFESCKDISMYLLSILGEENLDKPSHTSNNDFNDSGNAANLCVQEDLKRNSPVNNPSTPPISLPTDCEKQVIPGIVGPIDIPVDDVYKCLKCFLIFEGKIELFDHQALSHKNEKSQLGSSIPDWSIVIGGIFECKFCHRTFYEINQYNGHIGTHLTKENKTAEKTVDPVSISAESDHKISSVTESKKTDELVHDLNMNEDVLVEESGDGIGNKCNVNDNNVPETDKSPDVSVSVSKSECDLDQDIVGRSNGQDSVSEYRVQTSSIGEEKGFRENINDTHISSSFDELASGKGKVVNNTSSSRVFHSVSNGQDLVSETRVQASSICEEKGFQGNINDTRVCSSFDELARGKGKVVNNESPSGFFHGTSNGQNAISETRVRTSSICEEKGFQGNTNDTRVCGLLDESAAEKGNVVNNHSPSGFFHGISNGQDAVSEIRVPTSSICEEKGFQATINEKGKVVNSESSSGVFHSLAATKKLSETESLSLFSNTFKKAVNNASLISSIKQDSSQKLGFTSVNQATHGCNENRFHYNNSSSKVDEQYEGRNSAFDNYKEKEHVNKEYFHIENDDKSGEATLDEFQVFRNNESINNGLNANVMDFNTGKNIEFSSLVPPANNQAFGFQDGLKFDDIFGDKFDENIHELSLAFGNPNSLYEDTISVNEQKKDGLNCSSVVSSKINETFDVQTDLSMVNKRGNETRAFQNNGNTVYNGKTWDDFKLNEFRNSEDKKFVMGSGSNQHQCNEVVPRDMWKTGQGSQLQSGLVNPHAQIQSPSFHSFDIMSNKAEDGLLRVDERYNDGSNVSGFRSGRSEPVEFRFLTGRSEQNPHALQSGSRVFPSIYNTGVDQSFDSNFWMGKNHGMMMPNMGGRNVITSVCPWCRNEFHLPAMSIHNPQTQAGFGPLCPTCRISGQVNML